MISLSIPKKYLSCMRYLFHYLRNIDLLQAALQAGSTSQAFRSAFCFRQIADFPGRAAYIPFIISFHP